MVAVPRAQSDLEVRTAVVGNEDVEAEFGIGEEQLPSVPVVEPGMSKREVKEAKRKQAQGRVPATELTMRPGYGYRESNYQIGRAAERAGVEVKQFEKGDRFLAWRKKSARVARNAEKRALGKKKGAPKKARKQ